LDAEQYAESFLEEAKLCSTNQAKLDYIYPAKLDPLSSPQRIYW